MAKYIEEIKVNEAKMEEIAGKATSLVLEYKQKLADERRKIAADSDLTDEAKARKSAEIGQQIGAELLKQTTAMNREFTELAVKNGVKAEFAMADDAAAPVDPQKEALYNAAKADLQTKLMLATNGKTAEETLRSFIDKYGTESAFAADLANSFGQLAGSVIGATEAGQQPHVKHRLQDVYSTLQQASRSDVYREAEAAYGRAETAKQERLFKQGTINAVRDMFGARVSSGLNSIIDSE